MQTSFPTSVCDPMSTIPQCGNHAVCGTIMPGAGCTRGYCVCESPDYAPLFIGTATDCGRILKPGDSCTSNNDPTLLIPETTICLDNIVWCRIGLIAVNGSWVPSNALRSQPGESCDDYENRCNADLLLECNQYRQCQCASNLIFKDGRCQPGTFYFPKSSTITIC